MKRISFSLIILLIIFCPSLAQNKLKDSDFIAINDKGQTLYYKILSTTDKTVAVVQEKKLAYKDTEYTIPAQVVYEGDKFSVTEIGDCAFKDSPITAIQLPTTLLTIGKEAFSSSQLKEILIPHSVHSIGKAAFINNKNLKEVTFNEQLNKIGPEAFKGCAIKEIILPKQLKEIGNEAFSYNKNLINISIPEEIEKIGLNAFSQGFIKWYEGNIAQLPPWININNCFKYGIGNNTVERYNAARLTQAQPVQQPQVIYVQQPATAQTASAAQSPARPAPSSDVDQNIPEAPATNANTFAIIIANENYQEETPVQYALNDGQTFKEYCQKVLGLPEDNIHYREDATLNNILAEVDWISKVARAYNGEASLIVYYAGHGIPDEASGSSYLLPVDGIGNNLRTGYSLAELYKTLGALPARSVTVFMDACFSGAKRGEGMLASARGVAIKAKPEAPKGNMVVFSAAQGDETAYPYEDKGHGLFTYFLLKKLQETKGQVSLGELAQYVQQQVSRRSIVTNRKSQTPCVTPSESMVNTWKNKTLK